MDGWTWIGSWVDAHARHTTILGSRMNATVRAFVGDSHRHRRQYTARRHNRIVIVNPGCWWRQREAKFFFYDKEREAKLLLRVQEEEHDLFEKKKKKNTTTVRRRHRVRTSISLGTFSREDSRRTLNGLISCTSPPGIVLVNFGKNPVQIQLLIQ